MLATVAAADSVKRQNKKYSVFIYGEAKYKQTRKLCVLQYLDFRVLNSFSKKATIFSITSFPTLQNWSGKDPGTNKSSNIRLKKKQYEIVHAC